MLIDSHLHTSYSSDCDTDASDMINAAKSLGLGGINITDHLDLYYPFEEGMFKLDLEAYDTYVKELISHYSSSTFDIGYGIEFGLSLSYTDDMETISKNYNYDYCIGSMHNVEGYAMDLVYPSYYEGRDMDDVLNEYFECTLENINTANYFDSLGHMDYIIRYANKYAKSAGTPMPIIKCQDTIDQILKALIRKDKALEVNTGAFRAGLDTPNPSYDILKRYKELGGKMITLGSDAHIPKHVGLMFDEVVDILKEIGFNEYTLFRNRKPIEVPF